MNKLTKSNRAIALGILSIGLTACGGGNSNSGGGESDTVSNNIPSATTQEKNVTGCIAEERVQGNTLSSTGTRFTNKCAFTVNFARGFVTLLPQNLITLTPGQSVIHLITSGYIACRPPSIATNAGDGINLDLRCN